MVHTFEVTKRIKRDKFRALATKWFSAAEVDSLINGSIKHLINENAREYGINKVAFYPIKNSKIFVISLVINPQSLIRRTATIGLFDCLQRSKQSLYDIFAAQMHPVIFPSLSEWDLKRIDYTFDRVILDDDEHSQSQKVALYVELLQRARRPARFADTGDSPGSLHTKSASATINFYDKRYQVECELNHLPSYSRLHTEAANILRLEIECYGSKLTAIKDKHHLPDTNVGTMLQRPLSRETLLYYYYHVVGYGDYYSLSEASRLIQANLDPEKAKGVIGFLEMVANCYNLNEVMAQMPKSTYYDRINSCRQLGINPVTIPAATGINHLDNPLPSVLRRCYPQERVWTPRRTCSRSLDIT